MNIALYIISTVLTLGYLGYMAYEDVTHNSTVPVLPGYIAMAVGFVSYITSLIIRQSRPNFYYLGMTFIVIILLALFKVIGMGDTKALIAIAFLSVFSLDLNGIGIHDIQPAIPLGTYALGAIVSLPFSFKKSRKEGKTLKEIFTGKGSRIAFFPFLLVGFILTNGLLLLCTF